MESRIGFNPPGPEAKNGPVKQYVIRDGFILGYKVIWGKGAGRRVRYTKPIKLVINRD